MRATAAVITAPAERRGVQVILADWVLAMFQSSLHENRSFNAASALTAARLRLPCALFYASLTLRRGAAIVALLHAVRSTMHNRIRVLSCTILPFWALPLTGAAQPLVESDQRLEAIAVQEIEEFTRDAEGYYYGGQYPSEEQDPAVVLARLLSDGMALEQAALESGRSVGLTEPLSRDLAFGLIVASPSYAADDLDPETRAAAIASLYRVLESKPRIAAAWVRLQVLLEVQHPDCEEQRFLSTLFLQGVDYALAIHDLRFCEGILKRAAIEAPGRSSTLGALYNAFEQAPSTRIIIAELWREALLQEGVDILDSRHIDASVALVQELVGAGLAEQAAAFASGLPPEARERVLASRSDKPDALQEYVVALLVTGRSSEARSYVPELRRRESASDPEINRAVWTALRILVERDDAFDLFKATIAERGVDGLLFTSLLIDFYRSSGYADIAEYHTGHLSYVVKYVLESTDAHPELFEAFGDSFLERRRHYEKLISAAMPDRASLPSKVTHFSQPETQTIFEERAVVPEDTREGACRNLDAESAVQAIEEFHMRPIRAQQCGNTLVVLGMSQSLDPVGELGGGGYWLVIRNDAEMRWREVYTGLRLHFPYVARHDSDIPLLQEGVVQIHADIRELDVTSITFPPIGLRPLREQPDVLITASLSDLLRDSDDDGLQDIVEQRMLLDNSDPDFDGDGIMDGYDMVPNVPEGELTEKGAAFALVLEEVFGFESAAIVLPMAGGQGAAEAQAAEQVLEQMLESMRTSPGVLPSRTLFIIADPELFQGQLIPFRAIVLSREQARQVEQELGVFMPLNLESFWFSKDGGRALVQWSARWTGGTIYLEKSDTGRWQSEVLSHWIT